MKRVLTALILIPLVLLVVFKAPAWLMLLVLAAIALVAADEYLHIVDAHGIQPFRKLTMLLIVFFFLPASLPGVTPAQVQMFWWIKCIVMILAPLIFLTVALSRESLPTALPGAAASYLAIPYVGLGLISIAIPILLFPLGSLLVFYLLVVVWSGDIFAYYVGKSIGRHKLAPRISPGKTWEGAIASLIGAAVIGSLVFLNLSAIYSALVSIHLMPTMSVFGGVPNFIAPPLIKVVIASVIINAAAQIGDLVESMMKRGANIKDSGKLLPGHGGVLDRIDALLFAAPIAVLTFLISGLHRLIQ
jgi:phosphatidate cytidylyltransferase